MARAVGVQIPPGAPAQKRPFYRAFFFKAVRKLTVDGTHMSGIGNKLMAGTILAALGL